MAPDDEDSEDLYDDEFDFVDDDELDEEEDAADDDSDLERDLDSEVDDSNAEEPVEADSELDAAPTPAPRAAAAVQRDLYDEPPDESDSPIETDEEKVDEFGRPEPAANYVVHIYEYQQFKRTIDRPFTPEDAEAFASEYNRTSKPYGRFAIAGKDDAKPRKTLT